MIVDIKVPSVGESVREAVLAEWFRKDGDPVVRDDPLFVIETDKVTLEVAAEVSGVLSIRVPAGETVAIGAVVGVIETEASGEKAAAPARAAASPGQSGPAEKQIPDATPPEKEGPQPLAQTPVGQPRPAAAALVPPSVRRLAAEKNIDLSGVRGTGPGGRITKLDVLLHLECAPAGIPEKAPAVQPGEPAGQVRKPMSRIRRRIAERLLEARRNTAMLTTFNEIDMGSAMEIRGRYKDGFQKRYGVSLGFMSFFVKASVEALKEFPAINAFIEGTDIVYHDYQHIGVAVGSDKGLVVPVIRHAERLSFARIESAIVEYVKKIQENRLELADMEGGTFTITNGGVFGSLLSTPILNTPQSGILGMHKIEKRPVVVGEQIAIRPMMYVALSYDHRIVDGREAVTFLRRIKEFVENPERMLLEI